MKIQILGTGCPKCRMLKASTAQAVDSLDPAIGTAIEVEEITDLDTMMEMGMLVSPGFAIDGELVASGVLSSDKVKSIILQRLGEKHE